MRTRHKVLAGALSTRSNGLKTDTSAMSSLSGFDMATARKSAFKLSGNLERPPYPFPAGFIVTNMPALKSTCVTEPSSSTVGCRALIAAVENETGVTHAATSVQGQGAGYGRVRMFARCAPWMI